MGNIPHAISTDKNTVPTIQNNVVEINVSAIPFSEKDKIIQSYSGYHIGVSSGNKKKVKAIEVNAQNPGNSNIQSYQNKKTVVTGNVNNN